MADTNIATSSSEIFRFMDLPPAIRIRIAILALVSSDKDTALPISLNQPQVIAQPPLTRLSHCVRMGTLPLFYTFNNFFARTEVDSDEHCPHHSPVQRWLDAIGPGNGRYLRRLLIEIVRPAEGKEKELVVREEATHYTARAVLRTAINATVCRDAIRVDGLPLGVGRMMKVEAGYWSRFAVENCGRCCGKVEELMEEVESGDAVEEDYYWVDDDGERGRDVRHPVLIPGWIVW